MAWTQHRIDKWVDWRRNHECFRFVETVRSGLCLFCRINQELIMQGYEVVPFDVVGPYRGRGWEPTVVLQPIHWVEVCHVS